jgi:hypothetical protein
MIDVLAASDPAKNLAFLIMPVVWNEDRDRSADRLRGAVSEQPFRPTTVLLPANPTASMSFDMKAVVLLRRNKRATLGSKRCASR